jgi:hypothetical protein
MLAAMPSATGTLTKNASSRAAANNGRANGQINESGRCWPEIRGQSRKAPTQKNSAKAPTKAARPATAVRRATRLTRSILAAARPVGATKRARDAQNGIESAAGRRANVAQDI